MSGDADPAARPRWVGPSGRHSASLWHLAWLAMLAYQPVTDDRNRPLQWALGGLVIVVFVPFYVAAAGPGRARRWAPVLITLLGAAVTHASPVPTCRGGSPPAGSPGSPRWNWCSR